LFYGKISFQKDLNYFLPFLKNFFCCVAPRDNVINVLQMCWSFILYQCGPDECIAHGGAAFPPHRQSIPGALDVSPSERKQWLALYQKRIKKNSLPISMVAYHLAAFDSILCCLACPGMAALGEGKTSFKPQ